MKDTIAIIGSPAGEAISDPGPSLEQGAFIILCLGFAKDGDPQSIAALKQEFCDCPLVFRYVEASGAFDLVLEVAAINASSYYRWLLSITRPYPGLIVKEETSFSDEPLRDLSPDVVVWVPEGQGKVGLRRNAIDRIVAEGDYVRIHAEGDSWQVHATLQSYSDLLGEHGFARVHRSKLVRVGAIRRLKRIERRWFVELCDGSRERVARDRVAALKAALETNSPNEDSASSFR
ncbi:hypothetical protein GRI89_17545 [Altererythrobacter salegens]|uniref:HTH LytTR-type domain-containing protein n=1 Tax=Croceibacterium salegens TaxID=1737568 RepID=A0A6I4T1X9_9SPHN|nr:LytTR family DNA-binding domain-containing protein [Croceibacterium salegens]MXO61350.1 hypothetical protein [Croceibacterium salegens]